MNICFLTTEYPSSQTPEGGLGNYIRNVSLDLIKRGHKVTVFILCSKNKNEFGSEINFQIIKPKKFHWRFHRFKILHPWLIIFEQCINALMIKKEIKKINKFAHFDILQTPNYKTPGLFLFKNKNFPIVCRCSSYTPKLRLANGQKQQFADKLSDWLEVRQIKNSDAVFTPSMFLSGMLKHYERIDSSVINSPIDFPRLNLDLSKYSHSVIDKKYFLYFGTLNGVKGSDLLIEAAFNILTKNNDISFVFIGRNDLLPNRMYAVDLINLRLCKFIDDKRVFYFPPLPKPQLSPFITNAFGIVFPSRVDNYPNACLEAISHGVPVIGTENSSLEELIINEKTGFLAKNDDLHSLISAMEKLLNQNNNEREIMIKEINNSLNKIISEDRVRILLEFYRKVIDEFKSSEFQRIGNYDIPKS